MNKLTRAQLFAAPKSMRRAKERIERAQLLTASARERGIELAQKYESSLLGRRATYAQRRRLAQLRAL